MVLRLGESGPATVKACVVGAIIVLLMAPLAMLRSLVSERTVLREQAHARVAQGWGGDAVIGGPMLVVPFEYLEVENNVSRRLRSALYLLPAQLDVDVDMKLEPEPRRVGTYAVPVYLSTVQISGRFDYASLRPHLDRSGVTYLWDEARLRLPLGEVRSLREVRLAQFDGNSIALSPAMPGLYRGVETVLAMAGPPSSATADFRFEAVVAGSRKLAVLPLGSTTNVTIRSQWPHPAFDGAFLPVSRQISANGFTARWQVLELNRSFGQAWPVTAVDDTTLLDSAFSVGLYQAIDVYQRGERAVKYALLFIVLTFLTFFAWEQLGGVRLHPLQYLLVRLALSTFYLLLIALSEHISFALAYAVAACALVALIAVYCAGALRSQWRGMIAGMAMAAMYVLLYMLVLSEDYALLMGAIILFASLASVMLITRRIDWYHRPAAAD